MKSSKMTLQFTFSVLALIAVGLLALTIPVAATPPAMQEIQNLKIECHIFTTAITNSKRTIYVNDPSVGRYIVLVLSATLGEGEGKIFASDVTLRYFHDDGSEDRSRCGALALSETPESENVFDLDEFILSDYSWFKVYSGNNRFAIAFYVGSDVETLELYRLGITEPITYRIGRDRPYSIYLATNIDMATLLRAKEVIQKGGYHVVNVSEALNEEETGITILYREQSENQAREISQRIMLEFGQAPTLQKMELISDNDIVIWLGK